MSDAPNAWSVVAHEPIPEASPKPNGHGPDDAQKWGMAAIGAAHAAAEAAHTAEAAAKEATQAAEAAGKDGAAVAIREASTAARRAISHDLGIIQAAMKRIEEIEAEATEKLARTAEGVERAIQRALDEQAANLKKVTAQADRAEAAVGDTRALLENFGRVSKTLEAVAGKLSQSVGGRAAGGGG
jgi:hypothetical protein